MLTKNEKLKIYSKTLTTYNVTNLIKISHKLISTSIVKEMLLDGLRSCLRNVAIFLLTFTLFPHSGYFQKIDSF